MVPKPQEEHTFVGKLSQRYNSWTGVDTRRRRNQSNQENKDENSYETDLHSRQQSGSALAANDRSAVDMESQKSRKVGTLAAQWCAPTVALPVLVLVDSLAVSLVVPLLFRYYKAAGVSGANQRELLSAVFSTSQIVGGLLVGLLMDSHWLERRTILYISFGGSALSYALIVFGGFPAILLSRILVGLVKQTMTVSTGLMTVCTTKANRTQHLGRLTAATTVAWIVGPTVGALLYKYVHTQAPAMIASALFVLNLLLALALLPSDSNYCSASSTSDEEDEEKDENQTDNMDSQSSIEVDEKPSLWTKLRACFSSKALAFAVASQVLLTGVIKATDYKQLGSYYEEMYGLESHHRGYISSYQMILRFLVQSSMVSWLLQWIGGERRTTAFFAFAVAGAYLVEGQQSLALFLGVLCPVYSLSFAMIQVSMQSLVTHVAPTHSMFSVLAALDVLQNAVSVTVPFYRTFLFRFLTSSSSKDELVEAVVASARTNSGAHMEGDPDPLSWIQSSSLHWLIASATIGYMLLSNEKMWHEMEHHHDGSTPTATGLEQKKKGR